jgi:heat shock protein HtpX
MHSGNTLKTVLLLGLLSGLLIFGGQAIGGRNGIYIGLALAVVMNFVGYFFSDKIALASYSAQPVTPEENPEVYRRVEPIVANLTRRMGLPMPKLWLIDDDSPNAFATGHVLHRDILISSVAATIAAAITSLARMAFWFGGARRDDDDEGGGWGGVLMIFLAPIAAMLIQMAISRTREYDADEASAKYTGTPYNLISALQKLETYSKQIPMDASPATAHMFIIKPFSGRTFLNLFSTHPSTEDRIARLQAMR